MSDKILKKIKKKKSRLGPGVFSVECMDTRLTRVYSHVFMYTCAYANVFALTADASRPCSLQHDSQQLSGRGNPDVH